MSLCPLLIAPALGLGAVLGTIIGYVAARIRVGKP